MGNASKARRGGKKNRKHGRDKKKCEKYRILGTREKNKERKKEKERKRQERLHKRDGETNEKV